MNFFFLIQPNLRKPKKKQLFRLAFHPHPKIFSFIHKAKRTTTIKIQVGGVYNKVKMMIIMMMMVMTNNNNKMTNLALVCVCVCHHHI